MAEYISIQPTDNFNSILYTGTGSSQALTGVGFQPDFVWCKMRDAADANALYTSPTGTSTMMQSNSTAITTTTVGLTSFDSDGFTVDTRTELNSNTKLFVGWNWKAATTTGLSGGTITPSAYYINVAAGFGIYKYTGNSTAGATIAHGLGKIPTAMIIKRLDTTSDWTCYHKTAGNTRLLALNTHYAEASTGVWNDTSPTSTVWTMGNETAVNNSSGTYVAYVFAPIKGYSHFGSYQGHSSNANGASVFTGFRPHMLFLKNKDQGDEWGLLNVKSSPYNPVTKYLVPDKNNAEVDSATMSIDFLSNGFKIRGTSNTINYQTSTYVYWAWAEFPMVSSNDVPGVAR